MARKMVADLVLKSRGGRFRFAEFCRHDGTGVDTFVGNVRQPPAIQQGFKALRSGGRLRPRHTTENVPLDLEDCNFQGRDGGRDL